jgi:hypothetical protein
VLSNAQFESAIKDYNAKLSISDGNISGDQHEKISMLISEFFHFDTAENAKIYTGYVTLLFKNLIRFIGDDFTPLKANITQSITSSRIIDQEISGAYSATTMIAAGKEEYSAFAKRFAKEAYIADESFDDASAGEFLNVCNGLYAVNESNESGIELTLSPQAFQKDCTVTLEKQAFCIPVQFSFGEVEFIVAV